MNTNPRETRAAAAHEAGQFLTFIVGGEMFAIQIVGIKEIIEYGSLTTVPMMPGFIRGVINLRGAVVPVVDLAARFGRASSPVTRRSCVVIMEIGGDDGAQDIGLVVDSVSEVIEIPREGIEPPPQFGARVRPEFIAGIGKVGGRFVVLLDATRVLSVDEMALLATPAEAPASLVEA